MKYSYDQQIIKTLLLLLTFHVNIVSYRYGALVASFISGCTIKTMY